MHTSHNFFTHAQVAVIVDPGQTPCICARVMNDALMHQWNVCSSALNSVAPHSIPSFISSVLRWVQSKERTYLKRHNSQKHRTPGTRTFYMLSVFISFCDLCCSSAADHATVYCCAYSEYQREYT